MRALPLRKVDCLAEEAKFTSRKLILTGLFTHKFK